jgi:putative ABC transport system permease protein
VIELVREGWEGIARHKVRSVLSSVGILFGVAAVLGILAIGEGARREQDALVARLGILSVHLRNRSLDHDQQALAEIRRVSRGLSTRDVEALRAELPEARIGGACERDVIDWVPHPRDPTRLRLIAADPEWLAGTNLTLREGRPLGDRDERESAAVCLLGASAREELLGGGPALGSRVRIDGLWLTVVGVFEDGSGDRALAGVDSENRNGAVVIPLSTGLKRFGPRYDQNHLGEELTDVQITVEAVEAVEGTAAVAERAVRRLHRDQADVVAVVPLRLLEASRAQQRLFDLVMGLIAGISLVVGGIGIMNVMLASVLERTREIGIRRALGARPQDLALLFLVESSLVSSLGGALGVGAGLALARAVSAATGWTTAVTPWAIALVAALSVAEGVVFGLVPARRAARLSPVEAIANP